MMIIPIPAQAELDIELRRCQNGRGVGDNSDESERQADMALEPELAAIHEAGHAVLLWLVGWADDLQWLQFRRVDGGADLARMKFDRRPIQSLTAIRSTLIVLFGGSAASSEWSGTFNRDIDDDWDEAQIAVAMHFAPKRVDARPDRRVGFLDASADALVQDSLNRANEIVRQPRIRSAIQAVAKLLLEASPDENGLCVVTAEHVIAICERECGSHMQRDNPLADWIAGYEVSSG